MVVERVSAMETENLVLRQEKSSLQALYEDREGKIRDYEARLLNAEDVNESLYKDYTDLVEKYNVAVSFIYTRLPVTRGVKLSGNFELLVPK